MPDSRETPGSAHSALANDASRHAKAALRIEALARRDALDEAHRIETALRIAEEADRLCALFDVTPGTILSGFLPIRSEIDARPLMAALRAKGAQLCLPAVLSKTEIVFRRFDRKGQLVPAGFGTLAPPPDCEILDPAVMLVPLSAFDVRGHRIGYGAGHYDRAIARLGGKGIQPRLIGLAFDCQQVPAVPDEPHDRPLDAILTESGLRMFPFQG
ncbi:MAG: 5-formyltetrahydrofolate cyclo-ligase [Rhizobiaceae bacterium]|jgi:5-formyltetrahydrofolate cyclo-ligase|nr:5-formyltetrahydrofolate cyclo-ligase [Rhizobiaceae bacterium]